MDIIVSSDDDEDISMDIPIISSSSSPLLLMGSDGNNIKAVADSMPRAISPKPVILAIQRSPLVHTFSAKMKQNQQKIAIYYNRHLGINSRAAYIDYE